MNLKHSGLTRLSAELEAICLISEFLQKMEGIIGWRSRVTWISEAERNWHVLHGTTLGKVSSLCKKIGLTPTHSFSCNFYQPLD